jgi:hypothetical protein
VPRGNVISDRVLASVEWLRGLSQEYMSVEVVRPGDSSEASFMAMLVEDKSVAMMSYNDFVAYLHKEVQK